MLGIDDSVVNPSPNIDSMSKPAFGIGLHHGANAAEIYKWTDANGQVHFGDQKAAPATAAKVEMKTQSVKASPPASREVIKPAPAIPPITPPPFPAAGAKSKPVDPAKIKPECTDLIDQIAKVKPGTNWQALAQKFEASCPGIGYECKTYRTRPENNKCTWVERSGSSYLRTSNYE